MFMIYIYKYHLWISKALLGTKGHANILQENIQRGNHQQIIPFRCT